MKTPDPLPGLREPFAAFGTERVMPDTTLTAHELTEKLGGHWHGRYGKACCPAHEDEHPSLSISDKPGGGILVKCHSSSRCTQAEVFAALEQKGVLQPAKRKRKPAVKPHEVCRYIYETAHRKPAYCVVRMSDKSFPQFKAVGGGFQSGMQGVTRLPYLLPELLETAKEQPVFVCEGEKDCDNVIDKLKLMASTNSGGGGNWPREITKWFEGRDCIIVPDHDAKGREHAVVVGAALTGVAARVRVLELPDLAEGGDVSDWIEAGGTRSELLGLAKKAPQFAEWRGTADVAVEEAILNPADPVTSAEAFFAKEYKGGRLLCHAQVFYQWQGSHYVPLSDDDIEAALYGFLRNSAQPSGPRLRRLHIPFQPDRKKVGDVLHALRSLVHVPTRLSPPCWLDGRENSEPLIACRNGLLRLKDEKLLPHSMEYFNTSAASFDYLVDPPKPVVWFKFLRSCFPGDGEFKEADAASIDAIQEHLGYAISGDRKRQKIILHVGLKWAGKGVILRVLIKLLGGDSHAGLSLSSLATERFALEPLIGKQLASVPDARLLGKSARVVELLLAISGGDEITVPRHFKPAVTLLLNSLFWMLANEVPAFSDKTATIQSRFEIVQFRNSFYGKEDLQLEKKLEPELPGILKWALEGYRELEQQGHFTQPKSALPAVEAMRRLASPVIAFAESEDYVCQPGRETRRNTMYEEYLRWCHHTRQPEPPESEINFTTQLKNAFPEVEEKRQQRNTVREWWYIGIGKRRRRDDDDESGENDGNIVQFR